MRSIGMRSQVNHLKNGEVIPMHLTMVGGGRKVRANEPRLSTDRQAFSAVGRRSYELRDLRVDMKAEEEN